MSAAGGASVNIRRNKPSHIAIIDSGMTLKPSSTYDISVVGHGLGGETIDFTATQFGSCTTTVMKVKLVCTAIRGVPRPATFTPDAGTLTITLTDTTTTDPEPPVTPMPVIFVDDNT